MFAQLVNSVLTQKAIMLIVIILIWVSLSPIIANFLSNILKDW